VTSDSLLAIRPSAQVNGLMEPDEDDRLLLLELASDLQSWSAHNVVFRRALDRAAAQLIELANQTEPA